MYWNLCQRRQMRFPNLKGSNQPRLLEHPLPHIWFTCLRCDSTHELLGFEMARTQADEMRRV